MREALAPTVSAGRLQQANALLHMTSNATFVVGAAAGGLLVAAAGPGFALALDALSYFAGAAVLLAIRVPGRIAALAVASALLGRDVRTLRRREAQPEAESSAIACS